MTVSLLKVPQGILVGVRLRVSASNGMKALDASESYLLEKCPTGEAWSAPLCHALMIPIRLLLCSLKTTVYYDAGTRSQVVVPSYHPGFHQLRACFPTLTFQSSTKGFRVEQLRRKLQDLALGQTNEVRPSDLPRCLQQLALAVVASPPPDSTEVRI
ncbi:hypothetical protein IV102_38345 [bacterium]|nr:hypothetical protein [bacterium]